MATETEITDMRQRFLSLGSPEELANLLGIKYESLNFFLYGKFPVPKYRLVEIPKKSGGIRKLNIPSSLMKTLQEKLLKILTTVYEPKATTHGFVVARSILTNAESHMKKRRRLFVLNVDIENFFPEINFGRVRGMFMAKPYSLPPSVATMLANICCMHRELPQGAPTSPIIANMICSKLDAQLRNLANENNCVYTRYADDLTFSTSLRRFPKPLAFVTKTLTGQQIVPGKELVSIVESNGFHLNEQKVRLQSSDRRQEVTGLTVNKIVNVPKKHINQVRAMLHAWEKYGYDKAQEEHFEKWRNRPTRNLMPSFSRVVQGKIEYIGMVRGEDNRTYRKFWNKYAELDKRPGKDFLPMGDKIFISYSHKDKEWLKALKKHLKVLEKKKLLATWDDSHIKPGSKWRNEIRNALASSKAAILLVSGNFFDSDFIVNDELQPLLAAAEKEGLKILWIPVSASMYKATEINDFQALCDPSEPLDEMQPAQLEKTLVSICEKIVDI